MVAHSSNKRTLSACAVIARAFESANGVGKLIVGESSLVVFVIQAENKWQQGVRPELGYPIDVPAVQKQKTQPQSSSATIILVNTCQPLTLY